MRTLILLPLITLLASAQQKPTYHRDIAPIMAERCVSCHQPGRSGRFPLTTYEEVCRAAPAIHQAVRGQRMPPDEKSPHHNRDFFERTLRAKQIDLVLEWIEAGLPEGEKAKP